MITQLNLCCHYMKEGFEAFRDTIDLTKFAVDGYTSVVLFVLIGVQSSHATLVIIITALAAGQITYENGLGLAIGPISALLPITGRSNLPFFPPSSAPSVSL